MSKPNTFDAQIKRLRGVRLGQRERALLLLDRRAIATLTSSNHSHRMAQQRAARRLRDLELVEYEPSEPGKIATVDEDPRQLKGWSRPELRRTPLGQAVVKRFAFELREGRPIRWSQPRGGG
jgi:hypothetical protein